MLRNGCSERRFVAPRRWGCQALVLGAGLLALRRARTRRAPNHRKGPTHLLSPDGKIDVTVQISAPGAAAGGLRLTYDVAYQGKPLLAGATLSLDIDHQLLGVAPKITRVERQSVDRNIRAAGAPDGGGARRASTTSCA